MFINLNLSSYSYVSENPGPSSAMELEDLYRRYCIRLKHSLFLACLAVAFTGCIILLVLIVIFAKVRNRQQDKFEKCELGINFRLNIICISSDLEKEDMLENWYPTASLEFY